jgi:hypothetical protein
MRCDVVHSPSRFAQSKYFFLRIDGKATGQSIEAKMINNHIPISLLGVDSSLTSADAQRVSVRLAGNSRKIIFGIGIKVFGLVDPLL